MASPAQTAVPFSLMNLDGRRALVVGGSGALGLQIAETLGALGAAVGLAGRRVERCEAVADAVAAQGIARPQAFAADASTPEGVAALVDDFRERVGPVEILFFNAGAFAAGEVWEITPERWRGVFAINVDGPFFAVQECFDDLREAGGTVILMASVGGLTSFRRSVAKVVPYTTSKATMIHLTRDLAAQLADFGIRVNAIAPGSIDSGMTETLGEDQLEEIRSRIPLGRLGNPADLAGAISYLASDMSRYVTGQTLVVDGGLSLV